MIRHYRTLPYVSKRLPGGFANVEIVSVECSQVVKRKKSLTFRKTDKAVILKGH